MLSLTTPAEAVTPLAKKYKESLARLDILTVRDLLWHLPVRYEDFSGVRTVDDAVVGEQTVIIGTIVSIAARRGWRSKKSITEAIIEDGSGRMKAVWYNQRYLTKVLHQGATYYFSGKVVDFYGATLSNPSYERFDAHAEALHFGKLTPIYPSSGRLTQKLLRFFIISALKREPNIVEHLPEAYIKKHQLVTLPQAVRQIHFPDSHELKEKAIYRLKFEELWQVQQKSRELKQQIATLPAYPLSLSNEELASVTKLSSFELTNGQTEAFMTISRDIEKSHPMLRLLQGDVGSGKTVVAAMAMYQAVLSGRQAAIMAPTEVLAMQHFKTFQNLFKDTNITVCLLTSTSKAIAKHGGGAISTRGAIVKGLRAGTIDICIGTHALIQPNIVFAHLALIVVDEQQRFGVRQRKELLTKNKDNVLPHMLSLTATPIPRTYTHFLYGAVDISILSEMPKGRKKINTRLIRRSESQETFAFIRQELSTGRQMFVICPVISESDSLGVEAVATEEEKIKKLFPNQSVAVLHGRMTGPAKEKAMRLFADGTTDILISTAVVEVGIDVPNASIMLIESPERFGLAQLHQFRGRVGRAEHQSYCFVVADDAVAEANDRLKVFVKIDNGFELSEKDLHFRGPGELYGIRQSGFLNFKIATLYDVAIMQDVAKALDSIKD